MTKAIIKCQNASDFAALINLNGMSAAGLPMSFIPQF